MWLVPGKSQFVNIKNPILLPAGVFMIYFMVIPLVLVDISAQLFQFFYFGALGIGKIPRNDYINFSRWNLAKLSLRQKINCVYCNYANGVSAWYKALANQTELYSCAIKDSPATKGQDHQASKDYHEFTDYR